MDDSLVTATYWGPVLGTVVGVILGAIIAVFAEPARNWFYGPKLFLDFQPDDGRCVADSSVARYARVFVKNRGRRHMERCQAFVTNIEREEETGQWKETNPPFIDPTIPEWAVMVGDSKYGPRDLPRKIKFYINIVASSDSGTGNDELRLSVEDWPERIRNIFKPGYRYCFTITVTGDGVKPKDTRMIVNWQGNWKFGTASDNRR